MEIINALGDDIGTIKAMDYYIKLNGFRQNGVGWGGFVEISHGWHHEFSQVTRIELLDNWIKVLEAQLELEKSAYEKDGGLYKWK